MADLKLKGRERNVPTCPSMPLTSPELRAFGAL